MKYCLLKSVSEKTWVNIWAQTLFGLKYTSKGSNRFSESILCGHRGCLKAVPHNSFFTLPCLTASKSTDVSLFFYCSEDNHKESFTEMPKYIFSMNLGFPLEITKSFKVQLIRAGWLRVLHLTAWSDKMFGCVSEIQEVSP